MLKNSKGIILPEFFLAFSIWLVIALFFIPAYIQLHMQMKANEHDLLAHQLLYESLLKWKAEDGFMESHNIKEGNIMFRFRWEEGKEACVEYEGVSEKTAKICESI
ncbi:hypothetical protein CEQ21_19335 [Niallia circulans]|uniref:Uncharacterized protein n=1 Tax=Niallia circulans TaxID=1397 RepID=A0A553SKR7_NIACI|nr:hypothetical protein [Niallia circulans]TRZ37600.1 hypothetical protein CEQ21_19335 [Niallia circulans]